MLMILDEHGTRSVKVEVVVGVTIGGQYETDITCVATLTLVITFVTTPVMVLSLETVAVLTTVASLTTIVSLNIVAVLVT